MGVNAFDWGEAKTVIVTKTEYIEIPAAPYLENYPQLTLEGGATVTDGVLAVGGGKYATFPDSDIFDEAEQDFVILTAAKFTTIGASEVMPISSYEVSTPYDIYSIRVTNTGVRFFLRDNSAVNDYTYAMTVNTGEWYHFAIIVEQTANVAKCYINGILVHTFTTERMPTAVTAKLVLGGGLNPGLSFNLDGEVKMSQVYRGYLTDAEVAAEAAKV